MSAAKILIVDDEREYLDAIVERLKNRGFNVVGSDSGDEALSKLQGETFDLVLLDIKMPGARDGIDILREIKQLRAETEVILVTAHASVENCIEGMRLGAFDYLVKPVQLKELLGKMARALAHE
jgi:DNA-binding NtrC family response regulator